MYARGFPKMLCRGSIDGSYRCREGEFLLFLRVLENVRNFFKGLDLPRRDLFLFHRDIVDGCCEITGQALSCIVWIFDREGAMLWKKIIFSGDSLFT